jgi:hypothetical protein
VIASTPGCVQFRGCGGLAFREEDTSEAAAECFPVRFVVERGFALSDVEGV